MTDLTIRPSRSSIRLKHSLRLSKGISLSILSSIYIILCLSVCLLVCLYPINVKTAEPIGPKFCLQKMLSKNPHFFCYCFLLKKEKMLTDTDRATIKIKIEDGR